MAHSLSAKKRIRQNLKARARNRARKADLRTQVKQFVTALSAGDVAKAETELRKTTRALDRVAAKGTFHKNTASRKRSRLTRQLNAAKAAAKTGSGTSAAKA
ncbi:MAG: 30S ribosomal protein S20 [Planctomycetota bacterium]|nr:30S ribosomal protein S20 [Planctomycetota bacterium]